MLMKRALTLISAALIAAPSFAAPGTLDPSSLDTAPSALWWQGESSAWSPLSDETDGRSLAAAWRDAEAMETFLGVSNPSGWWHGSESPEIFPYWMTLSELATILEQDGNDGELFSRLEDGGMSADGALSVVKALLGARLAAEELDARLRSETLVNKARAVDSTALRSPDVEAAQKATRDLKSSLNAQDWAALGDYLLHNVAPAMSVRIDGSDHGRVFITWLPDFQARATYRGATQAQADATDMLTEACRQGFDEAQMPLDEKATGSNRIVLLRDGASLDCRVAQAQQKTLGDASKVAGHTIPSSMACGASVPVSVTMGNVGTTTWSYNSCYRLGSYGGYDPFFDANVRHNLPVAGVAPGETVTFNFTLDAPTTPGNYVTDWQMIAAAHCGGGGWFGAVASQTVSVSCGPDAAVDSHTLPASMYCGQVKTAQVTMENTGSTTWTAADGYALTYVDGTDPLIWYGSMALPTSASIAPGQTHTFDLTYRADNAMSGNYVTDFEMRDWPVSFGEQAASTVNVTCDTSAELTRGYGAPPHADIDPVSPGQTLYLTTDPSSDLIHYLYIKALGTDPLTISNFTTAWSGDSEIEVLGGVPGFVSPGQTGDVVFRVDENTPVGTYTGQLTLDLNSTSQPVMIYVQVTVGY